MNSVHFTSGTGERTVVITRVAENQWPGPIFPSIDARHGPEYLVPTDPQVTGLGSVLPLSAVTTHRRRARRQQPGTGPTLTRHHVMTASTEYDQRSC
jgi:hypothetical protein